jgi:catechol 2,3-dioxygenase-like lactoylglutathione lyase family enzyme
MKPRITLITIGVDDLERSLRFYREASLPDSPTVLPMTRL